MPRSSELDALCAATANRILCAEAHRAKSDEGVAPRAQKGHPKVSLRWRRHPDGVKPPIGRSDSARCVQNKNAHAVREHFHFGGATRNRTGDEGFADLCLTAWLWRRILLPCYSIKVYAFCQALFLFLLGFFVKAVGGRGESMKRAYRRELRIRACELATEEAAQAHETEQDGSPKTSVLHTEDSYRSSYPREKPSNRCLETAQSL